MNRLLLPLLVFVFLSSGLFSQEKNFKLSIKHMLKEQSFELLKSSENNLNHKFYYDRLEYYLSEISIIHDGGQKTSIDDLWVLVNADEQTTTIDLGDHAINDVEAIAFHVGVDPEHNHLDPTLWPQGHPLAPQFPSMHWGWASGYRFVALEGYSGDDLDQVWQLHGLGDANYKETIIELNSTEVADGELIELNANYSEVLNNIPLNSGVVVHADNAEARLSITNFNRYVFTASNVVSSTEDNLISRSFSVHPNPVSQDLLNIDVESSSELSYYIHSISGQLLIKGSLDSRTVDVSSLSPGMHIIKLYDKEGAHGSIRFMKL